MKIKRVSLQKFKQLLHDGESIEGYAPIKVVPARVVTEKQVDDQNVERVQTWVISDAGEDRENDTIDPNGGKFENFLAGGSVLFGHDTRNPTSIIGKPLAVWVENGQVLSRAQFVPREINPLGFMVFQMAEHGFVRSASIGFLPEEFEDADRVGFMPINFKIWELLEWSALPVAANPRTGQTDREAVAAVKSIGIDVSPMVGWAELQLDGEESLIVPRKLLEEIHAEAKEGRPLFKESDWLPVINDKVVVPECKSLCGCGMPCEKEELHDIHGCEVHYAENKAAISWKSAHPDGTPKADIDESWSGTSERAAATVEDLKIMSTWVDSENADKKGAYKLHHHKAGGKHALVWNGVKAAMGALLGARGGVDIPDGHRKGVYNHLKKHYKEFDKEAPEFKEYDVEELLKIFDACEPTPPAAEDEITEALRLADEYTEKALNAVLDIADKLYDSVKLTKSMLAKTNRELSPEMVDRISKALDALDLLLPEEDNPPTVTTVVPPEFVRAVTALNEIEDEEETTPEVPATLDDVRGIAAGFVDKMKMQLTGKVPDRHPQAME